ncbi:MAG: relaxase/mobilization nuclease domain-containing protein [Clostridia bacterium]|nr:relaxase/mobilization nuclease domain-containing protein [Clostridia bacterium]
MATTGFWPVRGKLKKVLDYADNPDKTTAKEYLDEDLYQALQYTEQDSKTDEKKYVSGVNCSAAFAYEEMMAIKRKYGERGKVVAYHGYQSFKADELTPEQCHKIGIETAKRMWGKDYQVLVTTHLNTDNLHNHFVVNSVSFRDGKKFRNSIEQHYELREISDAICKEHGLSVLQNAPFRGGQSKGAHWREERGQPTHRQQLKQDVEYCLKYSMDWQTFMDQLQAKGYTIDPIRMSVKADGWQRAVRLDRLGYTDEAIYERWDQNEADPEFRYKYQNHKPHISNSAALITTVVEMKYQKRIRTPWNVLYQQDEYERTHPPKEPRSEIDKYLDGLVYEMNHTNDTVTILVDAIFAILIALIDLASHYTREVILSADLRHELQNIRQFESDRAFLKENKLHTHDDLDRDIEQTEARIVALDTKRGKVRNQIRHETDPTVLAENKEQRATITTEITALRNRVKRVKRIRKDAPRLLNLLRTELQREYERKHPIKEQQRQRTHRNEPER